MDAAARLSQSLFAGRTYSHRYLLLRLSVLFAEVAQNTKDPF